MLILAKPTQQMKAFANKELQEQESHLPSMVSDDFWNFIDDEVLILNENQNQLQSLRFLTDVLCIYPLSLSCQAALLTGSSSH